MERTSDFEKLLFLNKMEGKDISMEQYYINNGIDHLTFERDGKAIDCAIDTSENNDIRIFFLLIMEG